MRRVPCLVVPILLVASAGCSSEKSFDERYDAAQQEVRETARSIDRDLKDADAAEPAEGDGAAPASGSAESDAQRP